MNNRRKTSQEEDVRSADAFLASFFEMQKIAFCISKKRSAGMRTAAYKEDAACGKMMEAEKARK